MFKNYVFWMKTAMVLCFVTAAAHALSFISEPVGGNDIENEMIRLITTHQMNLGNGFNRTFYELFTALSSCFSMMYLLGGLILLHLIRKDADPSLVKGLLGLCLLPFILSFIIMTSLTFLPPILLTALVVVSLTAAWVFTPATQSR